MGIIWCAFWYLLASDNPQEHKFITNAEKEYLANQITDEFSKTIKVSLIFDLFFMLNYLYFKLEIWKKIFTSKACIVLFIHSFTTSWNMILFLTNVPTYFKEVLKFDVQSNGLLSSIPYVVVTIVIIFSGMLSDKIIESNRFKKRNVRVCFSVLGKLKFFLN